MRVAHLHLVRHDGVVHIISYADSSAIVTLYPNGTPTHDGFRMITWCGKYAKMYCGGQNRITKHHPTCVSCVVAEFNKSQKDFT